MAQVRSTTTEYRIAVTQQEFLDLLVDKAKVAGLLPATFTPNTLQTYENELGGFDLVFTEKV